jgi:hypothetical protein
MEQSPCEANRFLARQEIPAFYETRKFITAFTSARHLSLPWASSIQSLPQHPTSSYMSQKWLENVVHIGRNTSLYITIQNK